jgi:hypothetical protein
MVPPELLPLSIFLAAFDESFPRHWLLRTAFCCFLIGLHNKPEECDKSSFKIIGLYGDD